jgi:hypothetical protein
MSTESWELHSAAAAHERAAASCKRLLDRFMSAIPQAQCELVEVVFVEMLNLMSFEFSDHLPPVRIVIPLNIAFPMWRQPDQHAILERETSVDPAQETLYARGMIRRQLHRSGQARSCKARGRFN